MTGHLTDVQKKMIYSRGKRLKMRREKKSKHLIREVTRGGYEKKMDTGV